MRQRREQDVQRIGVTLRTRQCIAPTIQLQLRDAVRAVFRMPGVPLDNLTLAECIPVRGTRAVDRGALNTGLCIQPQARLACDLLPLDHQGTGVLILTTTEVRAIGLLTRDRLILSVQYRLPIALACRGTLFPHGRAEPGSYGVRSLIRITLLDDVGVVARRINAQRLHSTALRERLLAVLDTPQSVVRRGHSALTNIHGDTLASLRSVPDHRHTTRVLVARPLCISFIGHNLRGITIQGDRCAAVQRRVQQAAIHRHPGVCDPGLRAHTPQPITQRGRFRQPVEPQYPAQRLVILEVAHIIQMAAAFMLHQNQHLDDL